MKMLRAVRFKKDTDESMSQKEKILEIIENTWKEVKPLVKKKYPKFNCEDFRVELNERLRTTGGRASLRSSRIEINEKLLSKNLEHVRMVFIHELSHLVQYQESGFSNHDYEFKSIMESLGCTATTYMPKNLDKSGLKSKAKKEYIYQCEEGCQHILKVRKHNAISRGKASYTCRRTKKKLEFVEIREERKSIIG